MAFTEMKNILIRIKYIVEKNMGDFNTVMGNTKKRMEAVTTETGKADRRFKELRTTGGRLGHRIRMLTLGTRGFRMELLSTMFFGMMLSSVLMGIMQPAMQMSGLFELISTTLAILFLPIALALMDALLPILMWFIELPEPMKMMIGALVLFAGILGSALFFISSFALGIGGLIAVLGAALAPVLLILGAVAAAIAIFALAWQSNFGNIRGHVEDFWNYISSAIGAAWNVIKGILDLASEFILGFFEGIFGEEVTWEQVWEAISTAVDEAWQFLKPIFSALKRTLEEISKAVGPVVEQLKPFFANAGKFLGGGIRSIGSFIGNTFGDVIWRPGQAPIAVDPNDTIVASKGGIGAGGNYNITIDIHGANMDAGMLAKEIGDRIENELRMRSR